MTAIGIERPDHVGLKEVRQRCRRCPREGFCDCSLAGKSKGTTRTAARHRGSAPFKQPARPPLDGRRVGGGPVRDPRTAARAGPGAKTQGRAIGARLAPAQRCRRSNPSSPDPTGSSAWRVGSRSVARIVAGPAVPHSGGSAPVCAVMMP